MAPLTRERQAMIEAWTWEFFSKNPGASQHACLRAANNAHIGPYPSIVRAVHQRFQAERLKSMQVLPARPETANGPRLVTPAWVEEDESPRVERRVGTDLSEARGGGCGPVSAFLSPTNSACCRLCGVRKPWAELHHHGGFMNYRCKDPATCSTADLELTPGEVADMKDGSRAEDDELEWNRRRELSGIDDDPIERW